MSSFIGAGEDVRTQTTVTIEVRDDSRITRLLVAVLTYLGDRDYIDLLIKPGGD